MAKHPVLKTILHGEKDGTRKPYRKGDELDLSPADAKPLIESGHLAAPKPKEEKAAK